MLSGIKKGKKKPKARADDTAPSRSSGPAVVRPAAAAVASSSNASVADQLRQSLAAGIVAAPPSSPKKPSEKSSPRDLLERRAVLHSGAASGDSSSPNQNSTVVLVDDGGGHPSFGTSSAKDESDMTVRELLLQEKTSHQQEAEARNVLRRGKHKRGRFKEAADSDEEEERQLVNLGLSKSSSNNTARKQQQQQQQQSSSHRARQIARHDRMEQITAQCWWWLESGPRFDRRTLLALGNHVSLVLAPAGLSVGGQNKQGAQHFYLVPLPHTPSLTACDDPQVWHELRRFQASLRQLAAARGQGVLFYETVLPTNSTSTFWQTRLECVLVPRHVAADAPLYFSTALTEQAEEWGTHQKLMKTGGSSGKDLRGTIPKGFSYFYVEFGNDDDNTAAGPQHPPGFVQMIETKGAFPKDFGADTILGMMHMDPLRFRSSKPAAFSNNKEEERRVIRQFLEEWKKYDWTVELDDEEDAKVKSLHD